ncbi:amidohydrolase [Frondihabitans sp. PAMC 28766]|uniref:amidohydrolase family protein n=1 Tax=Frondihabitans sp. PAMC 28766 TaxID=1795630 RepID=UPI00078CD227|nr:amidohydrolase family protein [Frondihabitans sp. PAMC 28766]AMM19979.1 amidohydrolase [Frondihabitans sp. PAMC 28766]
MRIITLEEHTIDDAVMAASAPSPHETPMSPFPNTLSDTLRDLDEGRLAVMDQNGIDVQVLSTLGAQTLPASAAGLVTRANDRMAAAVDRHPGRYKAFASLPTADPAASVHELERSIGDLGFVGAMIFGRTRGDFLDAEPFEPILKAAERLDVPIYLHPAPPPRAVVDWNYAGLSQQVTGVFETAGWGWHQETAVHFLHMALSGVFDRHPRLQFVLGHWGEMIPFYLDRLDDRLPKGMTGLDRTLGEYIRDNMYITPSGLFTQAQLQFCVETVGVDRIMYAVDYPFIGNEKAESFLAEARLQDAEKEAIAHGTAERVLRF